MVQLTDFLFLHSAKILLSNICVCEEKEESCHASFRGVKLHIQIIRKKNSKSTHPYISTASVTDYNEAKPPSLRRGIALETNQNPTC